MMSPLISHESRASVDVRNCFTLCQCEMTSSKQPPTQMCSPLRFSQSRDVLLTLLTRPKKLSQEDPSSRSTSMACARVNSGMDSITDTGRSSTSSNRHSVARRVIATRFQSKRAFNEHSGKHCNTTSPPFHAYAPRK